MVDITGVSDDGAGSETEHDSDSPSMPAYRNPAIDARARTPAVRPPASYEWWVPRQPQTWGEIVAPILQQEKELKENGGRLPSPPDNDFYDDI